MRTKILIVDDSAADRMIIEKMLVEFDTLTACDGEEALRIIEGGSKIDLMILDLNMPIMDGYKVLEILRDHPVHNNIRTIILTNYDELDNEIRGLRLGAVDYIRKPINMESLRARIDVHSQLLEAQYLLEQRLHDQDLTFDTIFRQAPIGIAIAHNKEPSDISINMNARINPMFEEITGRSTEELIRLGWEAITYPDDLAEDIEQYSLMQSGKISSYSLDKRYIKPDGSFVWVHMVAAPLTLSGQKEYKHISLIQDISKRKKIESDLIYTNEHDSCTGLYNRRYLENLLRTDAASSNTYKRALIGISLNSLNLLNKIYGFHYTLDLIKNTATALAMHASGDKLLFNLYENQFAFYMKNYSGKKELDNFCTSIANTLKRLLMIERIDAGIGVVEINSKYSDDINKLLKSLLIASEKAIMSHADFSVFYFNEKMEDEIVREDQIMRELKMIASDESDSELFLHYQPIIDLHSGRICCFEALARLNSQTYGEISPLEFIPLAEETKMIIPLGYRIIHQALSFMHRLAESGYNKIGISINISALQLLRVDFTERLLQIISDVKINPENIILEITESVLAVNYDEINAILGEIKESGIQIAIDDFGTGYSSLSRERELNINCLKIDKAFIDKLTELDPRNAITGDIISMAHKLGHWVVAEGVEHPVQKDYLVNNGCDRIQGYLISKPVDENTALNMLISEETR